LLFARRRSTTLGIDVTGNTLGLAPADLHDLERTFRRRVLADEVVSQELARHLTEVSRRIGRQVGVLLTREGNVHSVVVGDATKITVPDVGRLRGGPTRFRGVRLVHTHLKGEALTQDDLNDLSLLRLDMIAAIEATEGGAPGKIYAAHVLPVASDQIGPSKDGGAFAHFSANAVHQLRLDFGETMRALEEEFARADRTREATGKERALLVGVQEDDEVFEEMRELIASANVHLAGEIRQRRVQVHPRTVVGKGKLDEISLESMRRQATVAVFDVDIKPAQARAFEEATGMKAVDRTQLILDIFAQRAKSRDGKLQVELAQLKYSLPRLSEREAGLSKITGGIGARGPGETTLEISRRRVRDRITQLEREIEQLSKQRDLRRKRRKQENLPVISIIGYTNAGKSTLLNVLTNSDIEAANKLFVTLDPTSRRLRFPKRGEVIITDTVGFIRDLPEDLVNAFRATLEELAEADLLLHVVDAADPQLDTKMGAVQKILESLEQPGDDPRKSGTGYRRADGKGAPPKKTAADIARLVVLNKADLLDTMESNALARKFRGVSISAKDKTGIDTLIARCEEILRPTSKRLSLAPDPLET
jgi:GTP-binding protein HflX